MQNLKSYDMNDVLTSAPSNEMYSTPISTETNPSYGMRRNENLVQSEVIQGSQQNVSNRGQSINIRLIVILIVVLILLFLSIALVSIALSITSYSQQSEILSQLNNVNSDAAVQLTHCNISSNVLQILTQLDPRITCSNETQKHCGPGLWHQVDSLNMSDPSQQCPSAWREYNTSGIRACGRPFNLEGSCAVTDYAHIGRQYSRVCGRFIGYQIGSPDAFIGSGTRPVREVIVFDGISITYGTQQNHIWSYLAGIREMGGNPSNRCPCSSEPEENGPIPVPPQFIGDNYYCESGNPTDSADDNHFFSNDPLWDGQQCEGTCCNGTNSPPWFSVQLPAPTTDTIEVSICLNQGTADEDIPIELLEIYVQ